MAKEDYDGKLLVRAELVTQWEEIEDLIRSMRAYFDPEEISFFLDWEVSSHSLEDYTRIKLDIYLKELCQSLKGKVVKRQDLEESMMSEGEITCNKRV